MIAFYLYLGILSFMTLYSVFEGFRCKEKESYIVTLICGVMLGGLVTLNAFEFYIPLLVFFLFVGVILFFCSDFGLRSYPLKISGILHSFPVQTGIIGILALIAVVEVWIEFDKYWGIFQFIFCILMTVSFFISFSRVVRWKRCGVAILATLIFATELFYLSHIGLFEINTYLFYWVISVDIQSVILLFWRFGVRLGVLTLPEKD